MKKILLGLLVFLALGANAQIERGKLFVGGTIGLNTYGGSSETIEGSTTTIVDDVSVLGFNIIPRIGYMLTENIGAGLGVGYDYTKTTVPDAFDNGTDLFDQVTKNGTFTVSPFARYYMNVADKFYLFGELGFPIDIGSYKDLMWNDNTDGVVDNDVKYSSISYGFGLGLGANYFVSNNIALEAGFNILGLQYNTSKTTMEQDNGDKATDINSYFNLDFDTNDLINVSSFRIGVKIFL